MVVQDFSAADNQAAKESCSSAAKELVRLMPWIVRFAPERLRISEFLVPAVGALLVASTVDCDRGEQPINPDCTEELKRARDAYSSVLRLLESFEAEFPTIAAGNVILGASQAGMILALLGEIRAKAMTALMQMHDENFTAELDMVSFADWENPNQGSGAGPLGVAGEYP